MPYKHLSDLPDAIKNTLPQHAQEIYRATFNNAWDEYKNPSSRIDKSSREETAHKVAWAAVKKQYVKNDTGWKKR